MNQNVTTRNGNGSLISETMVVGDFSKLTMEQRHSYIMTLCESLQINPLSRPIEFMVISGRLVPYAKRDCADQLRKRDKISVKVISQGVDGDLYVVHVQANTPDGRVDEDFGAVNIGKLTGEARANAILKAVTKAKRRVTLSICGLGFLDETEVESIPGAALLPTPGAIQGNPLSAENMRDGIPTDPADMVAESSPPAERLKVADQRKLYEEILKELAACKTEEERVALKERRREDAQGFSDNWRKQLNGAFMDRKRELAAAATETPAEYTERVLSQVSDPGMLSPKWDYEVEPHIPPEAYEECMAVYRKHEQRLAP